MARLRSKNRINVPRNITRRFILGSGLYPQVSRETVGAALLLGCDFYL